MATSSDGPAAVMAPYSNNNSATAPPPKVAGGKVANIHELLERILTHLPPKNIILVKQVSQHFNHTITSSPQISDKFLLPLNSPFITLNEILRGAPGTIVLPLGIEVWCSKTRYQHPRTLRITCTIWGRGMKELYNNKHQSWGHLLVCREATRQMRFEARLHRKKDILVDSGLYKWDWDITLGGLVHTAKEVLDACGHKYGENDLVEFYVDVDGEGRSVEANGGGGAVGSMG